ncbi:motility associated factor glycosyltransferase family protein [Persephonella sp.]
MLDKKVLLNNLITLKKVNSKLLDILVKNIDRIEENLEILLKGDDFDVVLNSTRLENIKQKARDKVENLEKAVGVIWTHTMKINYPQELIDLADNLNPPKDKLIKNTEALIIMGTIPFFHIEYLLKNKEKYFPSLKQVIIYEPRIELIYLFMLSVDIDKLAKEAKINLTFSYNRETLVQHMLLYFTIFSFVSYLKSYEDAHIKEIEQEMIKLYEMKTVTIPYEHALLRVKHLKDMIKLPDIRYLLGIKSPKELKNTPVVIVGSGPSLDDSIETLKKIKDRVIIVALTTAVKTLVENGIIPDFATIADAQENMVRFLEGLKEEDLKKTYIFSAIFTEAEFTEKFKEGLIFNYGQLKHLLNIRDRIKVNIESGATVLNTTFSLLTQMGFSRFYLFGVDLGTKYRDRFHTSGYTGRSEVDREVLEKSEIELEGNYGGTVITRKDYYVSKVIFEEQIKKARQKNKKLKIYNFSDGARIEGTEAGTEEALKALKKIDKKSLIKKIRGLFKKEDVYILESEKSYVKKEILPYFDSLIKGLSETSDTAEFIRLLEGFELWSIYRKHYSDIIFNNEAFAKIQTTLKILKLVDEEKKKYIINNYRDYILEVIRQMRLIAQEIIS